MLYLKILLFFFWLGNIFDYISTYISLSVGNSEYNPLYLIYNDIYIFAFIKIVIGIFFSYLVIYIYKYIDSKQKDLYGDFAVGFLYYVIIFSFINFFVATYNNLLISL